MDAMRLGTMKRITDLRSVWHHEERDFSKWLAENENLKLLSDAIGIDIVLEERESSVGSFSVDIYALEESTERRIIIENQLEDTNHDHLGKLITYASGKEAEIIVWVVKRARDEHRQAIEWLNENTGVNIGFFLVEIELWQIDDSAIAPKFNVVERPNDWAKQMKNVGSLSATKQLQLQFWQQFSEFIKDTYPKEFTSRKAFPQSWYDLSIGRSAYRISLTVNIKDKFLGAAIYIPDDKDKFAMFKEHALEIEKLIGEKVEWREATKSTQIIILRSCDISEKDQWNDDFKWLMDKALKFKKIVNLFDK